MKIVCQVYFPSSGWKNIEINKPIGVAAEEFKTFARLFNEFVQDYPRFAELKKTSTL